MSKSLLLTYGYSSIGMALTDTLDDLISARRIEPQLAMKILANFDRSITEVLAEKVRSRLTFKVLPLPGGGRWRKADADVMSQRVTSIPTASATKCGHF